MTNPCEDKDCQTWFVQMLIDALDDPYIIRKLANIFFDDMIEGDISMDQLITVLNKVRNG
jgi:hypothetical protein